MLSRNHPHVRHVRLCHVRLCHVRRALFVLAAAVCCLLPFVLRSSPAAAQVSAAADQVRVGIAVPALGSGLHAVRLQSETGFTIGVCSEDGRHFDPLFSLGNTSLQAVSAGTGSISLLDGGQTLYTHTSPRPLALKGAEGQPITLLQSDRNREYPGFLELTPEGSSLRVINVVDTETYVKCVMGVEIGTAHPKETRRAFSVLIRTFPLTTTKHASKGCDVCSTNCCQVYPGIYRRDAENDAIVDSTKGEYITYGGEPIHCFYHDGNGGASCSSVAAWGGSEIPYLKSVSLPETAENASEIWQYVFTKEELFDFLSSRDAFRGLKEGVEKVEITETDPYGSGYVTLLSVTDADNNLFSVATSDKVRTALRFSSANFTVSYTMEANVVGGDGEADLQTVAGYIDGNGEYRAFDSFAEFPLAGEEQGVSPDRITFDGVGSGHGVGFSVAGADQLAAEGYSYRYLIAFFFPGTGMGKLP